MNDLIVVEIGLTAREADLHSRELERLACERGSEVAWELLAELIRVVPQYVPTYVQESVARLAADPERLREIRIRGDR